LENGHFEDSIRLEVKSATNGREVDFEDKGECNWLRILSKAVSFCYRCSSFGCFYQRVRIFIELL